MLAEAIQQYKLAHRGLAHRLQRQRELIAGLSEHKKVPVLLRALSLHVEPVTLAILEHAANLSTQHRLLTNDAVTVAIMEKLGLSHLVTNDDNFDLIQNLSIWKPR
jgi:predicted nucleic acid-binding protein